MYPPCYHANFNPNTEFEKWALVEVFGFDSVPDKMEIFVLESGDYAGFVHRGFADGMDSIFTTKSSTPMRRSVMILLPKVKRR